MIPGVALKSPQRGSIMKKGSKLIAELWGAPLTLFCSSLSIWSLFLSIPVKARSLAQDARRSPSESPHSLKNQNNLIALLHRRQPPLAFSEAQRQDPDILHDLFS